MAYFIGVKLASGQVAARYAENIVNIPDVTDDGETICVLHPVDEFPITADFCNIARVNREYQRGAYAAAGSRYPG